MSLEGHAGCVEFLAKFGVPMLTFGGGMLLLNPVLFNSVIFMKFAQRLLLLCFVLCILLGWYKISLSDFLNIFKDLH